MERTPLLPLPEGMFIDQIQEADGKLAESSDKSERGEPVCPNIRPNFSWVKVRT